jgi:hypothetical protein
MAEAAKAKARKAAHRTQTDFEQASDMLEQRRAARRAAFKEARDAGLSTREIAGHRVETILARYTHAVGRSYAAVRVTIG